MQSYRDSLDRQWSISVDVDSIKRVRQLTEVDLYDIKEGNVFQRLATDPFTLAAVLWSLCKPEAEKLGIDENSFARGLAGDAIAEATQALLQGICDFFPDAIRRKSFRRVLATMKETENAALKLAETRIDGMIEKARAKALTEFERQFTDSQELLESTPDH